MARPRKQEFRDAAQVIMYQLIEEAGRDVPFEIGIEAKVHRDRVPRGGWGAWVQTWVWVPPLNLEGAED